MRHSLWILAASLLLTASVFAQSSCTSTTWGPSTIYGPAYWNSGITDQYSYQAYKWDSTKAAAFNAKRAHQQFEVRRTQNKWNFFSSYPWEGIYWTNIPLATQIWSEESGTTFGPDEEMQIKSYAIGVAPNALYYVQAKYKRLLPAALMTVYTESEYCGSTFPICNTGTNFGWCIMSTRNLYSQR